MRLAHWFLLLILILIPVLHRVWKRLNRPSAIRFPVKLDTTIRSLNPIQFLLVVRYFALALIVFSLARPQMVFKQMERKISGIDIMMVMDISRSMDIEDLADRPRLDVAKDTMKRFIEGRQNDRIGFVVFSGEPLTLAPPTLDYGVLLKSISDARTGVLKDGTAIGDGLALAVNRLRNSTARSRVIILLTDGDNNMGQVDPMTSGELAAGYGIRTYTIAIGKEGRVKLPIRTQNVFGQTVTTYQWFDNALNPELLQKVAEITRARFYRVTDVSTLESVFKEIDQLEKSEIQTSEKVEYEELYQKYLAIGLILLLLEQLMRVYVWRLVL